MEKSIQALAFVVAFLTIPGRGDGSEPMPVFITPYYSAEPGQTEIRVGKYSDRLAQADAGTIQALATDMARERDTLPPETLYVLAIRLFDLGQRDDGVYWFYTAQMRSRMLAALMDEEQSGAIGDPAFELRQAHQAFFELTGPFFNRFAFGDLERLKETLRRVAKESKSRLDWRSFAPEAHFLPEDQWPSRCEHVKNGLAGLIDTIERSEASIRAERAANGLDNR
ncbi:MAG: hypothetical protein AB7F89_11635 [Pirellulaceae bacterium]